MVTDSILKAHAHHKRNSLSLVAFYNFIHKNLFSHKQMMMIGMHTQE